MGTAIPITRLDHDAASLRRLAAESRETNAARRMLALAMVLEGAPRRDAARVAGMDRQTLRGWVHRYNAEGLDGLLDSKPPGQDPWLTEEQMARVAEWLEAGPDPEVDGVIRWRRIFEEHAVGRSSRTIAVGLNTDGIPGPSGNAWGHSTINGNRDRGTGILNNELYIGRLVWNRLRYVKDPMTGKRVSRLNPEEDWIIQDVPEMRIVDQDLWDRVKARRKKTGVDTRGKASRGDVPAAAAPRNSESRALSYAMKCLKRACPSVRWVQSFADERCGRLGVVYQAANFLFLGSHLTTFYSLDGETYHQMLLTAHRKGGQRGAFLRANLDRAARHRLRQYRYIFFLKPSARRDLRMRPRPYPKPGFDTARLRDPDPPSGR